MPPTQALFLPVPCFVEIVLRTPFAMPDESILEIFAFF
jgi:hypothetical protein